MPRQPRVFIPRTTAGLADVPDEIDAILRERGADVVIQTGFLPDWRSVPQMLQDKLIACDSVIALIGCAHGGEPECEPARRCTTCLAVASHGPGCVLWTATLAVPGPTWTKRGTLPSAARCGCAWRTPTFTAPASYFGEKPYPWESPQADLAAAEKLINNCGYHRCDEELADAKRAILRL